MFTTVNKLIRKKLFLVLSLLFLTCGISFSTHLQDVEDDLARSTVVYLPRIMTRLLYTLSQDRKVSSAAFHNYCTHTVLFD